MSKKMIAHRDDVLGFKPLMSFRQEMDRLFDDFFQHDLAQRTQSIPRCNIAETDKAYQIEVEAPGMSDKDIHLSLDNNVLSVNGEQKIEHSIDKKNYHCVEFEKKMINRAWELPHNVDTNKLDAVFKNGVLMIELPKKELGSQMKKKIEIKKG